MVLRIVIALVLRLRIKWLGQGERIRTAPFRTSVAHRVHDRLSVLRIVDERGDLYRAVAAIQSKRNRLFACRSKQPSRFEIMTIPDFSVMGRFPDSLAALLSTPISLEGPTSHLWHESFP
jgi:hypothetical protein